jgi:hypothetical protein
MEKGRYKRQVETGSEKRTGKRERKKEKEMKELNE